MVECRVYKACACLAVVGVGRNDAVANGCERDGRGDVALAGRRGGNDFYPFQLETVAEKIIKYLVVRFGAH